MIGLASSGTRLIARLIGIPAGVSLFVSATPWPGGGSLRADGARLTTTDVNGAGNYTPVATSLTTQVNGSTVPIAAVPVTNGTATAVWEITDAMPTGPGVIENFAFAVFLAYPAGNVTADTGLVLVNLAPLTDAGALVAPRFSTAGGQTLLATVPAIVSPSDLIANLDVQTTDVSPNSRIYGTASVTNRGNGFALAPSTLRVQLLSGATPVGAAVDCAIPGGVLIGATTGNCTWYFDAPSTAGTYTVRATADVGGTVAESDETNNVANVAVHVNACQWTLQRQTVVLSAFGGVTQIPVQTGYGCNTQITGVGDTWATASIVPGAPAIVTIQVQANPGAARSTTVTVSGQPVTVWQTAAGCTYSVSPGSGGVMLSSRGETKSVPVVTQAGCPWIPEIVDGWTWLSAAGPANAAPLSTGPGRMDVTAPANSFMQRTGFILIGGDTGMMVTQFGGNDTTPPFGSWDSPVNNATGVTGAIPVSGWALDNTYVAKVQIWRDPVEGEPTQPIYIGDATFVNGARPDVAALYLSTPFSTRAGWGYQLLTNMLPGNGNGTYTLRAYAIDDAGNSTSLGSRTITCTNAASVKPFGTIDFPAPGEIVSGSSYLVRGWALTPNPAKIAEDGSTIFVWVDGVRKGSLTQYNLFRADVAGLFPGYMNSNGSFGRYRLDTTTLPNGVHTIAWAARDTLNRSDGLGSRYFEVNNAPAQLLAVEPKGAFRASAPSREGVWLRTGYDEEAPLRRAEDVIEVPQAERIELHLPGAVERGCLVIGGECSELPAGSTLQDGAFSWQIGAAFLGDFELRFSGSEELVVRMKIVQTLYN